MQKLGVEHINLTYIHGIKVAGGCAYMQWLTLTTMEGINGLIYN
jgi:hypothetical protein